MRLGIVTGLVSERDAVRRATPRDLWGTGIQVRCSGARAERARRICDELLTLGVDALLSFGIAGGLAPDIQSGDVVLATHVDDTRGGRWPADPDWSRRLVESAKGRVRFTRAALIGVNEAVLTPDGKRALAERFSAAAIDMESHVVAQAASAAGLPFLAIRVVADPSSRNVPDYVLRAVLPDGTTAAFPFLRAVVKRPSDLPGLLALALETRKALATLRRVAAVHGPFFGLV